MGNNSNGSKSVLGMRLNEHCKWTLQRIKRSIRKELKWLKRVFFDNWTEILIVKLQKRFRF